MFPYGIMKYLIVLVLVVVQDCVFGETLYKEGEKVPLIVGPLFSPFNVPMDYDTDWTCTENSEQGKIKEIQENLGEVLSGYKTYESLYKLNFKTDVFCQTLCSKEIPSNALSELKSTYIKQSYAYSMYIEGLRAMNSYYNTTINEYTDFADALFTDIPVGWAGVTAAQPNSTERILVDDLNPFDPHEPLSTMDNVQQTFYLYNHHTLVVYYTEGQDKKYKIEGFRVVAIEADSQCKAINQAALPTNADKGVNVTFTYDVVWRPYKNNMNIEDTGFLPDTGFQIFDVINALLVVILGAGVVAYVLSRLLHKDYLRFQAVPTDEEKAELAEDALQDAGWKQLKGDVYRPPSTHPMLFAALIGSGTQLIFCIFLQLVFAMIGIIQPQIHGAFALSTVLTWNFMSFVGGWTTARIVKNFNIPNLNWRRATIYTATIFPGLIYAIAFVIDLFTWGEGSVAAIPFSSMLIIGGIWIGIAIPLTFLGAHFGFKSETYSNETETHDLMRAIPPQPWYNTDAFVLVMAGFVPFTVVFVVFGEILQALWFDHSLYLNFTFVLLIFLCSLGISAEVAIIVVYLQ
eukprot:g1693.t1